MPFFYLHVLGRESTRYFKAPRKSTQINLLQHESKKNLS